MTAQRLSKEEMSMKKYFTPDVEFLVCSAADVITASGGMKVSTDTPDVDEITDGANFL